MPNRIITLRHLVDTGSNKNKTSRGAASEFMTFRMAMVDAAREYFLTFLRYRKILSKLFLADEVRRLGIVLGELAHVAICGATSPT